VLLRQGANPNARDARSQTPLILAARYSGDPATLRALLGAKGADLQAKDARGRTALDLLQWRRNTSMVALLKARGATGSARLQPVSQQAAIQRGLGMIQLSTATFQKKVQCMSCHHQGLGLMATGLARERGFPIDRKLEAEQEKRAVQDFEASAPLLQQILQAPEMAKMIPSAEIGDLTPSAAYPLAGVAAHGKPADPAIAAMAVILGRLQFPDGHWQFGMPRVPIQSSYFTMTALSIRAMQAYAPKEYAGEMAERLRKSQGWLVSTPTRTSEDRASKLLALNWAGAPAADRAKAAAELLADQKPDGGWSQLPTLRSDAYATGLALYALNQGGDVPVTAAAYRQGVSYLLRTQDEDGSWYVNKRAIPANNYMDAGFPHGESQYASYGATAWATMALILAERPAAAAQARR
jgi:hypothetical protein